MHLSIFSKDRPQTVTTGRDREGELSLPVGGGPDIVHAVYGLLGEDGTLRGVDGDGVVYLVRWLPDGRVESWGLHQYGAATLVPASTHCADQAPLFVRRELRPVRFEEGDIRANRESVYRPGEEMEKQRLEAEEARDIGRWFQYGPGNECALPGSSNRTACLMYNQIESNFSTS